MSSDHREGFDGARQESDLLADYLAPALKWDSLQGDARMANAVFDRNQKSHLALRDSPEGRAGITALVTHENRGVRLTAASHALAWDPAKAVPALEALEASVGLHSVTAKYTLRSFRSGTLDLDWQP